MRSRSWRAPIAAPASFIFARAISSSSARSVTSAIVLTVQHRYARHCRAGRMSVHGITTAGPQSTCSVRREGQAHLL